MIKTVLIRRQCAITGRSVIVESLLGSEPMQSLEKSSLIDLAKLSGNRQILALLKDIPEKE